METGQTKLIYFDNNATTAVAPEVYQAMAPFFTEHYFNASSMYAPAREVAKAIASSRETIAEALGGVKASQIIFTSCATESNNTAIYGAVKANRDRRHIVTSSVEHPAVLEVCRDLQRNGYEVTFLEVDRQGNLSLAEFVRALRRDTLMVTLMHANNETGVVFPVAELARLTKETDPSIVFHTDATQTVGKVPIDLTGEFRHVDLLSCSGHKLHAPKGVGVLYLKPGTPCRPLFIGGHQEGGRRAGTENVPYIVGMARAMRLCGDAQAETEATIASLRDKLEKELLERIPHVEINGGGAVRIPNTCNISIHFVEGEGMLYQLSEQGICASSGSACTSGSLEPSHVLRAMKVPFTAVHGSIRFSLSRYCTERDVDRVLDVFPTVVSNLRKLSPYWDTANNRPRMKLEEIPVYKRQ